MILVLVRNKFVEVPGALARHITANVWEVRLDRDEATRRLLRRDITVDGFDDAVFLVGGVESIQAMGSSETPEAVVVTVLLDPTAKPTAEA